MRDEKTGRFRKGQSGNPAGRPVGSSASARLRKQIEDSGPEVVKALVQKAMEGDVPAMVALLDRVVPKLKPESAPVDLDTPQDRTTAIVDRLLSGQISADVAKELLQALAVAHGLTAGDTDSGMATLEELDAMFEDAMRKSREDQARVAGRAETSAEHQEVCMPR